MTLFSTEDISNGEAVLDSSPISFSFSSSTWIVTLLKLLGFELFQKTLSHPPKSLGEIEIGLETTVPSDK